MDLNPSVICAKRAHTKTITQVAFSEKGNQLASCSGDATVKIWDVKNFNSKVPARKLVGHTSDVHAVVFSRNSKMIATGGNDQTVRVWLNGRDAPSTSVGVASVRSVVRTLDFGWDDSLLLCAADTINIWKVEGLRPHTSFKGHTNWVRCAKFNRDSKLAVSSSDDKTVRTWDVQTRKNVCIMDHHAKWVTFDPTSRYVASAGFDKHIIVWDYRSDVPAIKILAHDDAINCVDFYVDGFRLVSASLDNTIKLWDLRMRGTLLYTLEGYSSPPTCAQFSPLGTHMASASDNLILWNINSEGNNGPSQSAQSIRPEIIADDRPQRINGAVTPQPSPAPPLPATPPPYPVTSGVSDTASIPDEAPPSTPPPHRPSQSHLNQHVQPYPSQPPAHPAQSQPYPPQSLSSSVNEKKIIKSSISVDAELVATLRLIMHKVTDLDNVVETMSSRVAKTQNLVSFLQDRYNRHEQVEHLGMQLSNLEEGCNELTSQLNQARQREEKYIEELKLQRMELDRLKHLHSEAIADRDRLDEELMCEKEKLAEKTDLLQTQSKQAIEEQNRKWEKEMDEIKKELHHETAVARQIEESKAQTKELLDKMRADTARYQQEREQMLQDMEEMREDVAGARRRVAELEEDLAASKRNESETRSGHERQAQTVERENEKLRGEVEEWKKEAKRGYDELARTREDLEKTKEELVRAKGRWKEKEARALKEFNESKENLLTGTRFELEVKTEKRIIQLQDEHKQTLHTMEMDHLRALQGAVEKERVTVETERSRFTRLLEEEQLKTAELREQKSILEGQVRELRELTKQLHDTRVDAEKEINGLRVRVDELTNHEFELQQQLQEEEDKRRETEELRADWEEKHREINVKYEQLSVAHDEIIDSYNTSQNQIKQLSEDRSALKEHLGLEGKVRIEAEHSVTRLNKQIAEMSKVEQTLDDALAEERARRQDAEDEVSILRSRLDAMKKVLSDLREIEGPSSTTPQKTSRELSFTSRDPLITQPLSRTQNQSRAEITREIPPNAEGDLSASDLAVKIYHRQR